MEKSSPQYALPHETLNVSDLGGVNHIPAQGANPPHSLVADLGGTTLVSAPTPETHVFHVPTWQQQFPGHPVDAAIEAARAQGFEVQQ